MDEPPGKGQAEVWPDGAPPEPPPATGGSGVAAPAEATGRVRVVVAGPTAVPALAAAVGGGVAVLVAGDDAAAVGEVVAMLRAAGCEAAGWVGNPSDAAVREMAAELFPGADIVFAADT